MEERRSFESEVSEGLQVVRRCTDRETRPVRGSETVRGKGRRRRNTEGRTDSDRQIDRQRNDQSRGD